MNSKSNGSMNRVFRVVWNASSGVWQAVSELARGQGKRCSTGTGVQQAARPAWSLSGLALAVATTLAAGGVSAVELGLQTVNNANASVTVGSSDTITSPSPPVSGNQYGISVMWSAPGWAATILNLGTIRATAYDPNFAAAGVRIIAVGMGPINTGAVSVRNAKMLYAESVAGGADALYLGNLTGPVSIENMAGPSESGNIMARGRSGRVSGIYLNTTAMATGDKILNGGEISATSSDGGTGNTYGISVPVMSDDARVENAIGSMLRAQNNSLTSIGSVYGIYAGSLADTARVSNLGSLSVTSTHGSALGINVDTLSGNSRINNGGTISMLAGGRAWGLLVGTASGSAALVNAGLIQTINGQTGPATGIEVGNLGGSASIVNQGRINLQSSDSLYGINVNTLASGAAVAIDNSGAIRLQSSGSGAYGMNIAAGAGEVRNSGTIDVTRNGAPDLMGLSLSVWGSGVVVTNTATGVLNGNLFVNGTLNNAGTISLPHNANADQGGVLSARVDTFVNTGKLEIGLQTNGTTTTHSQLLATNATFDAGSKISVNILPSSTNVGLLAGKTLRDVVKATTLTVNADPTVEDNSALLNFQYVKNDNSIDLLAVAAMTISAGTLTGGGAPNAQRAAVALNAIQANGGYAAMAPIFSALNALPTEAAVAKAVNSLSPASNMASLQAGVQINNSIQNIVGMRQHGGISSRGFGSGDPLLADQNFWLKPFGSWGKQDDKSGQNGFDLKTQGLGLGLDGEYAPKQKLGLAFFYTKAGVDMNNMAQKADIDAYAGMLYGNLPVLDDQTNLLYQAGYTVQKTRGSRQVDLTAQTAKSNYAANVMALDLKLMRDYPVSERLLLQPLLSVNYRNLVTPSYTETGAGAANQQVSRFASSQTTLGVGVRASYQLDEASKLMSSLQLGHDLRSNRVTISSAFEGASAVKFQTYGIDNGRSSYELGLGYERKVDDVSKLNVMYTRQGQGNSFTNNAVSAMYSLKF